MYRFINNNPRKMKNQDINAVKRRFFIVIYRAVLTRLQKLDINSLYFFYCLCILIHICMPAYTVSMITGLIMDLEDKIMGQFKIEKCSDIEGLYIIEPKVFGDARGYFLETYNYEDFKAAGLNMEFVQDNQSRSTKGVLRGLHFQKIHQQGKLVRVLEGKVYDVAVDVRKKSQTYGKYYGVVLEAEKKNMFYIPEGFAHGFVVLSDTAEFAYKCTDYYHPEEEGGIIWNDETIAIDWPIPEGMEVLISDKDAKLPKFSEGISLPELQK